MSAGLLVLRNEEDEGVELGSPVVAKAVMYAINWSERTRSAGVRGWNVLVPLDLHGSLFKATC